MGRRPARCGRAGAGPGPRRPCRAGDAPKETSYLVVGSSSAAHGLHDLAEAENAEFVGPHAETPHHRLFAGSTADRLLAGAPCPVGVAPRGMRHREIHELRTVGVAYLDTPEARAALAAAARLAALTGASLQLYTVVAEPAEVMPLLLGRDAEQAFTVTARETYQAAIDEAIATLSPRVRASGHVLTGDPVEVLAGLEGQVDVLVCGSRGYGPVRRVCSAACPPASSVRTRPRHRRSPRGSHADPLTSFWPFGRDHGIDDSRSTRAGCWTCCRFSACRACMKTAV